MNGFIDALTQYAFLQNALWAGLLASIGCGIIGTYVVVKRISYLASGIAHAALGGMGVAWYFSATPITGALVSAIIAALIIGWVRLNLRQQEDILISALWALGMAIGLLFIAQTEGAGIDLMSYLFGSILLVGTQDLWLMAALDGVIILMTLAFQRQFLAVCFDEEFARVRGVSVSLFYMLLLCLVALTVVLMIRVVGLILVIALLTIPAAIASQFAGTLRSIMLGAGLLGVVFNAAGLALSYAPGWPVGATIVLLAAVCYLLVVFARALIGRHFSVGPFPL